MNSYLHGTAVIGAISQLEAEKIALTQKIEKRVIYGALIGAATAVVGLPLVWKSHRVLGGLLGLFVVGPACGVGGGLLMSWKDIEEMKKTAARQEALKQAAISIPATPAEPPAGLFVPW